MGLGVLGPLAGRAPGEPMLAASQVPGPLSLTGEPAAAVGGVWVSASSPAPQGPPAQAGLPRSLWLDVPRGKPRPRPPCGRAFLGPHLAVGSPSAPGVLGGQRRCRPDLRVRGPCQCWAGHLCSRAQPAPGAQSLAVSRAQAWEPQHWHQASAQPAGPSTPSFPAHSLIHLVTHLLTPSLAHQFGTLHAASTCCGPVPCWVQETQGHMVPAPESPGEGEAVSRA